MSKATCSGPGCDRDVLAKDLCGPHYGMASKGLDLRPLRPYYPRGMAEDARFFARVTEDGECWRWSGAIGRGGYGNFVRDDRSTARAHRWAYEFFIGEIPSDLHLDHLCRNRACVNPWHLEPVTPRVNVERIPVEYRNKPEPWAVCGRGHPMSGENLYVNPTRGNRYCLTCQRAARKAWVQKRSAVGLAIR